MADGKLAILLPTYRFDATARHCIETAASMAGAEIEVYIGDNSCDPEKWTFLRELAQRKKQCHVYCHENNIGGDGNILFLTQQQSHEFLCFTSDDDVYTLDYFVAGAEELIRNQACSAASGLCLVMTQINQSLNFEAPGSNLQRTASERIANYLHFNTMPYTVHRRSAVSNFHIYLSERPFFPSYIDQILTYTILSQGTHVVHPERRMFVYNNNNWSDAATCMASDARFYVAAGLPAQFVLLHHMCWAIDVVHYFNSTYRPACLSDAEADKIAMIVFERHFERHFKRDLANNLPAVIALLQNSPQAIAALDALLSTRYDEPARLLNLFNQILHTLNADLAARYHSFATKSLR